VAIFALADTHLSLSVDKPMDVFGSRWAGYMAKLDKAWRELVNESDTVIIPGDISWAMTLKEAKEDLLYLESLPGKKIISKGNHDYWWDTVKKITEFFAEHGIKTIQLLHNNAYIVENMLVTGTRGWYPEGKNAPADSDFQLVANREVGRLTLSLEAGEKLMSELPAGEAEKIIKCSFIHFPPVYRDYVFREIVDVLHRYKIARCYFGHIHGVYDIPPVRVFEGIEFIPVAADYLDFVPLRITENTEIV